ncbi:MAG: flagellar export chaperone FliS [Geothrix sp.]|uniref:flagellar export chaperone FliS n=1 Tax=Geothrix sp. TaxID=1962974 RepID=UPI003BB07012
MTFNIDPSTTPIQSEPPAVPEHIVVLLLEAAQRFLVKLEEAIVSGDTRLKDHFTKKVLAILEELQRWLNHEQGGELVDNLIRLYGWWHREILIARGKEDVDRLMRVHAQMGDMRQAWEYVLFQGEGMSESPEI